MMLLYAGCLLRRILDYRISTILDVGPAALGALIAFGDQEAPRRPLMDVIGA